MNDGAVSTIAEILRSFNRDTARLAAGILGTVVCAALVLAAALIQEGHPKVVDQAKEETQTSPQKSRVVRSHAHYCGLERRGRFLRFSATTQWDNENKNPARISITG